MSKTLLIESAKDGKFIISLISRGELDGLVVDTDLKSEPSWICKYPSGKIHQLKNFEPYEEPWNSAFDNAEHPEDIDFELMFDYVGQNKEWASDVFEKLQQENVVEIEIDNFPLLLC